MVNSLGNYNNISTTGIQVPVSSNRNTQNTGTQQTSQGYTPNDSYAFNLNSIPTGKVPDVKVGISDKISGLFKDVLNTPQNLQQYKLFESTIKSNPQGFLLPGSDDMARVKDVQRKLNFLGYGTIVNGNFGEATEKAISKFKTNAGINDGFLNKKGEYAVSGVVTPQVWNLLNSQVANKLGQGSPNNNVSVSKQELDWAKALKSNMDKGYKPTQEQREQYNLIYQKQQMSLAQSGITVPTYTPPPSQADITWAKQLVEKVNNFGYKPPTSEIQRYQDIQKRQQLAKKNPPEQNTETMWVQNTGLPTTTSAPKVSAEDMDWAKNMAANMKRGYQPTQAEEDRYRNIYAQAKGQTASTGSVAPPSREDMLWAKNLEDRVTKEKYNPTKQEAARYDDIFARAKNASSATAPAGNSNPQAISTEELAYAQQFEKAVQGGFKPSTQEYGKYKDIYDRYQQFGVATQQASAPTGPVEKPTDGEVKWAIDLETRSKQGYKPTNTELAIYNEIAKKVTAYSEYQKTVQTQGKGTGNASPSELAFAAGLYNKMQSGYTPTKEEMSLLNVIQTKIAGGNTTNVAPPKQNQEQQELTQPVETPTITPAAVEFSYNAQTIKAFKDSFPNVQFQGGSVPYLPSNVAQQVAQQLNFGSVEELQSAVGASVDGKFGPETFFRLQASLANQGQTKPQAQSGSLSLRATAQTESKPQNGVTQAELDWAVNLQKKIGQKYKPNQEEVTKFNDIFKRYEASGQQVVAEAPTTQATNTAGTTAITSNPPSEEEMAWAVDLQNKVAQKYTPTQAEADRFNDIFKRYEAARTQTQQPQVQTTQTQPVGNNTDLPAYRTSLDPNTPKLSIDIGNPDEQLTWALGLLDRVQSQGYVPNDQEVKQYEQIIAAHKSVVANP